MHKREDSPSQIASSPIPDFDGFFWRIGRGLLGFGYARAFVRMAGMQRVMDGTPDLAAVKEAHGETHPAGQVRVTDHAKDEADSDSLTLSQVFESVDTGEVIEDCPLDRPYPSGLISGRTKENLPVHSVWAYNAATAWALLVTVYKPDPD